MLERFDLVEAADRRAQTYSGGMKRRLDLAMTLIARPRLIFLDEPTSGLDPRSRRDLWAIVREQVADGVTVLLTTQYLDEADQLADRIGVLDGGRLVAEGTAAELKRRVPAGTCGAVHRRGRAAARPRGPARRSPTPTALDPAGAQRRQRRRAAPRARTASTTTASSRRPRRSSPRTSTTCSSRSPATRPRRRTDEKVPA